MSRSHVRAVGVSLLVTLAACANPSAKLAPGAADFGSVSTNKPPQCIPPHQKDLTFQLTVDAPRAPVAWSYVMTPGDFIWGIDTLMPNPFPQGKSTYTVSIQFAPLSTGDQTAFASIWLADPTATSTIIALKGRGTCDL